MRLNCLLAAIYFWFCGQCHGWLAVRRSSGLRGLIPHFAHISRDGMFLTMVDFGPLKSKDRSTDEGDSHFLFKGVFRVRRYMQVGCVTVKSLSEAKRESTRWTPKNES